VIVDQWEKNMNLEGKSSRSDRVDARYASPSQSRCWRRAPASPSPVAAKTPFSRPPIAWGRKTRERDSCSTSVRETCIQVGQGCIKRIWAGSDIWVNNAGFFQCRGHDAGYGSRDANGYVFLTTIFGCCIARRRSCSTCRRANRE